MIKLSTALVKRLRKQGKDLTDVHDLYSSDWVDFAIAQAYLTNDTIFGINFGALSSAGELRLFAPYEDSNLYDNGRSANAILRQAGIVVHWLDYHGRVSTRNSSGKPIINDSDGRLSRAVGDLEFFIGEENEDILEAFEDAKESSTEHARRKERHAQRDTQRALEADEAMAELMEETATQLQEDAQQALEADEALDKLLKLQEAVQAILPNHSVKIHKNLKQLFIRDYDDSARDILKRNGYKYTSKYGTTYMIGSDSYGRSLSLESLEDARKLVRHLGITDTHIITDEDNQIVVWIPKILVTTTFKYLDMIGVSGYVKQNGTVVMPYPKRGKTKGVKDD